MSDHDIASATARVLGSLPAPTPAAPGVQREAAADGATCRLGDASCASAHAAQVNRSALGDGAMLHLSLQRLQRDHGNRFVGQVLRQATGGQAGHESEAGGIDAVERSIEGARGGGHGMGHAIRSQMEGSFGADFSGVRIHHDARADGLSQALSARAFTTGRDVFFRQGEYSPESSAGRELLAHELTHVVQQNGPGVQRKMSVSQPGDAHEVEADEMAQHVMRMEHTVQRQPEAPADDDERKLHRQADPAAAALHDDDEPKPA